MDKPYSSRKQRCRQDFRARFLAGVAFLACLAIGPLTVHAITLLQSDALKIGKKIWQNECNGTVAGLTSWNEGENFASLGIGHFIWYPKGQRGPFEESFPKLVSFISNSGVKLPTLLLRIDETPCPWNSRAEFLHAEHTQEMNQLRRFLADTVNVQAEFLIARLQNALPKMLAEAVPSERAHVQRQFERVAETPQGCYALADYVNFKGEGVLHTERYRDQGWGLLQVLEGMNRTKGGETAVEEFSRSARDVLIRRVRNAPAQRHESQWLSGWIQRVKSYSRD
ncbi:MAG: hypothetical protein DME66_05230 [Verrucomicrobia bacterium]|nr:MAG: hypothetical protein DME66_05230 [Verrucomicrobiota bacterium]